MENLALEAPRQFCSTRPLLEIGRVEKTQLLGEIIPKMPKKWPIY